MRIQARGGSIHVDDAGSGSCTMLFLHSLAGSSRHWRHQLEHVRSERCGIAIDLRGHGRSAEPLDGDYSLEAAADDVLAVMDGLGLHSVVLVGHSMGGGIAAVFAGLHPDRVSALLLIDPVGDQSRAPPEPLDAFIAQLDSPDYDRVAAEYFEAIAGSHPPVRDQVLHDLRRTPRESVIGMLRALTRTDLAGALTSYLGPKHAIVTALNDYPYSLHRVDPATSHTVVEDTGHWVQLERPAELNRMLDDFIVRVTESVS